MKTLSKKLRLQVYNKLDGHCGYCGRHILLKEMQVDHMNPKCLSTLNMALIEGIKVDETNHIKNLMPTCRSCNHYKRADTVEGFRRTMLTLHQRLAKPYINKVGIIFGIITITPFDGKFYFEKVEAQTTLLTN